MSDETDDEAAEYPLIQCWPVDHRDYPITRCRSCGWIHVGVPRPEPAGDCCFRCNGYSFDVVIDTDELRRLVPPGVTLQGVRWPVEPRENAGSV